ncbi:MAG: presenilin family intramembrane aspartyl protease PSH [Thermoplasmata archaeon]
MKRDFSSIAAMAGLLILAQSIAMLMAIPFDEANLQVFEDPYDIANPLLYVGLILLVSVIILAMVKLRRRGVIKHIILVAFGLTILMVFYVVVLLALNRLGIDIDSAALIGFFVGVAVAVVLTYLLYRHPEWYVVDFVGVCVAAAVAAILGISLAILPVFILLIILAIYDAVSVYKTKHMVTLADAVTQERLPVLLVVPRRKGYSSSRRA